MMLNHLNLHILKNIEFKIEQRLQNEYFSKNIAFGLKILKEFKGVTMEQMEELAKKYHLNINIYEFHKSESESETSSYYDLSEQFIFDKTYPTHSALLFSKDQIIHIMYIKESEKLTKIHIYLKCHSFTHRVPKNIFRFDNHVKYCDDIFRRISFQTRNHFHFLLIY